MADRPRAPSDPKVLIQGLVDAMLRGHDDFGDGYHIVPNEFEVHVSPAAYEALKPILDTLTKRAERKLDRALHRLNARGPRNRLGRLLGWIQRHLRLKVEHLADRVGEDRYEKNGPWRLRVLASPNAVGRPDYLKIFAQVERVHPTELGGDATLRGTTFTLHRRRLAMDAPADAAANGAAANGAAAIAPHDDDRTRRTTTPPRPLPPPRPLARLHYEDAEGPQTYDMCTPTLAIGRCERGREQHYGWVNLRLHTIPDVSRDHLRIRYDADRRAFEVKDVSRFGTRLNGRLLPSSKGPDGRDLDRWHPLTDHDLLSLPANQQAVTIRFESLP